MTFLQVGIVVPVGCKVAPYTYLPADSSADAKGAELRPLMTSFQVGIACLPTYLPADIHLMLKTLG